MTARWWGSEAPAVQAVLDWIDGPADYVVRGNGTAYSLDLYDAAVAMLWVQRATDDPRRACDAYFDAHIGSAVGSDLIIAEQRTEAVAAVERFLASGQPLPTLDGDAA